MLDSINLKKSYSQMLMDAERLFWHHVHVAINEASDPPESLRFWHDPHDIGLVNITATNESGDKKHLKCHLEYVGHGKILLEIDCESTRLKPVWHSYAFSEKYLHELTPRRASDIIVALIEE